MTRPGGSSIKNARRLKVRVKTGKGRTVSQKTWLERQLNDPYVAEARRRGYRSRAAFKLSEIDDKYHFLKAGGRIVDLGAGSGYFTWRFAKAVGPEGKAIALEIESNLVEKLKSDASRKGLANYEARLVPTDDPQLAPGSVDVIFLCDTYHHINNRVQYFRKARQSLRQGGRLVILDMVRTAKNPDHSVVREEVIEELQQAGYRLAKELDFLLPRQYFLQFEPVAVSTDEHEEPRDLQHLRSIMA